MITNISQRPKIFFIRNIALCWVLLRSHVDRHVTLPIGDICNEKSLIFGLLKLSRDMVNYEMLSIGENNFKAIQLRTFHCLRFKELSDKIRLKSAAFY